jgi:hypothetical protein
VISTILGVLGYELRRVGSGGEAQNAPGYHPWRDESGEFEEHYERARPRTLVSADRCYVLYRLLLQSLHVEGDAWECGVYAGGTAALLAGVLRAQVPPPPKKLYLFDTFEGMPQTDPERDQHARGGFVVLDDYGFPTCPGARAATDEFFAGRNALPLCLPTAQAVVFKGLD